jgi:hypothetical protein
VPGLTTSVLPKFFGVAATGEEPFPVGKERAGVAPLSQPGAVALGTYFVGPGDDAFEHSVGTVSERARRRAGPDLPREASSSATLAFALAELKALRPAKEPRGALFFGGACADPAARLGRIWRGAASSLLGIREGSPRPSSIRFERLVKVLDVEVRKEPVDAPRGSREVQRLKLLWLSC